MIRLAEGVFLGDQAGVEQIGEGFLHGDHALVAAGLDRRIDLMGFALADNGSDCRGDDRGAGFVEPERSNDIKGIRKR